MTGPEIFAEFDRQNREALKAMGGVPSEIILGLLNQASLRGFRLGGQVTIAAFEGAVAVKQAAAA